jgi:hypothetical protein
MDRGDRRRVIFRSDARLYEDLVLYWRELAASTQIRRSESYTQHGLPRVASRGKIGFLPYRSPRALKSTEFTSNSTPL